jgi:hypothetical protein
VKVKCLECRESSTGRCARHREPLEPEIYGGQFYERTAAGMTPTTANGRAPDLWICRRLADYLPSQIPKGGAIGRCRRCDAAIVFNPARLDTVPAETPRVCMQCASIQPLPIES